MVRQLSKRSSESIQMPQDLEMQIKKRINTLVKSVSWTAIMQLRRSRQIQLKQQNTININLNFFKKISFEKKAPLIYLLFAHRENRNNNWTIACDIIHVNENPKNKENKVHLNKQ